MIATMMMMMTNRITPTSAPTTPPAMVVAAGDLVMAAVQSEVIGCGQSVVGQYINSGS